MKCFPQETIFPKSQACPVSLFVKILIQTIHSGTDWVRCLSVSIAWKPQPRWDRWQCGSSFKSPLLPLDFASIGGCFSFFLFLLQPTPILQNKDSGKHCGHSTPTPILLQACARGCKSGSIGLRLLVLHCSCTGVSLPVEKYLWLI